MPLIAGDTLEPVRLSNEFIFDKLGNFVGIKNPRAVGSDFRPRVPNRRVAAAGDSLVAGAVQGGSPYGQALATGALAYVGNFAVAGKRTDEIASQIPSAATAKAGVLLLGGGVNDIVQGVAEATLRANVISNISYAQAYGMDVVDLGLPPTNTSANVPRYVQHEVWRRLYCYKNDVLHADVWPYLATAAGAYTSGLNADAIHYNSVGAIACKDAVLNAFKYPNIRTAPLLAMTDTSSDHSSFIANAVSFTDSNADGIADNWFSSGSGGTYSITPAAGNEVGNWQKCAMTGGTNVGFTSTAVTLASLGWATGDKLAVGANIRWSDSSQALAVSAYFTGATMDVQPLFQMLGGASGNSIYLYGEQTIIAGTVINMNFFASGTGYFEVNRPMVVNLTKLGLA